ncbi:FkbM family methyltransferase [Sediminicoccus rosea]|jgi:FkbM family methyltransferase|uniref:FkbM family methyltransferase n=1 Tax=Sediminicoccus rosea TaxID=1225128 RepID=A0ABZ0PFU5_9PROT|nr:FkbM family methyltransferase [Sediminicoccus rosea]WPB84252.1 FkbM family methyltransferase [Sediminicoccus rosea]
MKNIHGWCVPDADTYVARKHGDKFGRYQRKDLAKAISFVRNRTFALDIGGHIGTSAVYFAGIFGRVVSFEPAADTFECLTTNIQAFGVKNVECRNFALSDAPGQAQLMSYPRDPGNVGARFLGEGEGVEVRRLDDFGFPGPDFVKIDVEGWESRVLLGGKATILQSRPVIMFEVRGLSDRLGADIPTPQSVLAAWGAQCLLQLSGDEVWGWADTALPAGG